MRPRTLAILHPLLVSIFPLLMFGVGNLGLFHLSELLLPLAAVLVLAVISGGFWWLLTRDIEKAALLTSLSQSLFLLHGHLQGMIVVRGIPANVAYPALLFTWLAVLAFAFWQLRRETFATNQITQFVTVAATLLVCLGMFNFARGYYTLAMSAEESRVSVFSPEQFTPAKQPTEALPDIYYIILDGYGRNDQLMQQCGFDNSAFTDGLRDRGFFVADKSNSNYAMTFMSLASSLNLRYMTAESERLGRESTDRRTPYAMEKESDIARYLQAKGYKYVHLNTWFPGTDESPIADVSVPETPSEFNLRFVETTILRPYAWNVANLISAQQQSSQSDMLLTHFKTLEQLPEDKSPTFTLAHIISPHPPYMFDQVGNVVDPAPDGWTNLQPLFVEQLKYINKRMNKIVDTIVAESEHEPIIIIQADHGTAFLAEASDPDFGDNPAFVEERMAILNAYYVPEKCREQLYDSITPVNTFRVVLNSVFGEKFPLLPDEIHFSWYYQPYDTADVTQQVRSGEQIVDRRSKPRVDATRQH